ncbi:MAG TPA: class I SAM-dependent methyltransferase [Thermoanaerobaculia bacterium]|nr:class I SAM-dependent methyltransferase [Thermoanaerobaculia bacterium]
MSAPDLEKAIPCTREPVVQATLRELRLAHGSAPAGELSQFASLVTAHQYRLPWALTASLLGDRAATVLDWGCGDGHFSYFLLRAGHSVVSYSLQHPPKVLRQLPPELARRSTYVQGRIDEPTRLPFPDSEFDAVASVGVLEHVRETGGSEDGSLREIRRVLKSGGRFLCFHLPNRHSAVEWTARAVRRNHHAYRYSDPEIRGLVEAAGLEVEDAGAYAFLPRNMLSRLPRALRDSPRLARILDASDDGLAWLARTFCQNRFVVARRR